MPTVRTPDHYFSTSIGFDDDFDVADLALLDVVPAEHLVVTFQAQRRGFIVEDGIPARLARDGRQELDAKGLHRGSSTILYL
jgi:hypothetical protein